MKTRVGTFLALTAAGAIFVWGGCALVIDLGDPRTLAVAEASVGTESEAGLDAGDAGDAAPSLKCGLMPVNEPKCDDCFAAQCCETGVACGADPECVLGLECIKDCMAQIQCISACLGAGNAALGATVACSSTNCTMCTPPPACQDLGACAAQLDDAGQEGLLRRVCRGTILDLDPEKCESQRKKVGETSDAAACH